MFVVLSLGGWWLWSVVSEPAPGQKVPDLGREHVTALQVATTKYNSNPPTSGPHLETWVKPGIYTNPQSEGELIHSLEHGYIIVSYNCGVHLGDSQTGRQSDRKKSILSSSYVYAHEEDTATSATDLSPPIATGSAINDSSGCQTLIKQLEELVNRKKLFKLIVLPRPKLDTTIAITAWGAIDKFDVFDVKRIERFIDYYRDHGPEKTME